MGQIYSQPFSTKNPVNYSCPVCSKSKKIPNAGGRFFLINDKECQCNGCKTIFDKTLFYNKINHPV